VLAGRVRKRGPRTGPPTRPLIDTAAAAPFLYSARRVRSGERRTAGDFYVEGELMWLDVYAKLRISRTERSRSTDSRTVLRHREHAPDGEPVHLRTVRGGADAYQPYDWDGYFKTHVYAVAPHPPSPFEALGWKLVYTATPNSAERRAQKEAPRARRRVLARHRRNEKGLLSDVLTGSPAAKAGLGVGDTIVAVDNREFSSEVLDEELKAPQSSSAPIALIVKRGDIFRTVIDRLSRRPEISAPRADRRRAGPPRGDRRAASLIVIACASESTDACARARGGARGRERTDRR
jgi:predicted metalloprotease with PDZ domain